IHSRDWTRHCFFFSHNSRKRLAPKITFQLSNLCASITNQQLSSKKWILLKISSTNIQFIYNGYWEQLLLVQYHINCHLFFLDNFQPCYVFLQEMKLMNGYYIG